MEGKIFQKNKIRTFITILIAGSVLSFGMYWYIQNEDFFVNQKIAYLGELYFPLLLRGVDETVLFLAASGASLEEDEEQRLTKEAEAVPILLYHGVVTDRKDKNIHLSDFREQMFALKDAGWETISLDEFRRFMHEETQLPEKSFLLTFDDARKDSYYPVDPILRTLDYEAVMFVITGQSLGEKGQATHFYLSEKELERMENSGRWDVQSHGKSAHTSYPISSDGSEGHFYSNLLWLPEEARLETPAEFQVRVEADLKTAKQDLESLLGEPVYAFAFPFGDFGQNLNVDSNFAQGEELLVDASEDIYSFAFYQWWEGEGFTQNYPNRERFLVKRIDPQGDWSGEDLIAMLDHGTGKALPYADAIDGSNGWLSTWGSYDIIDATDELVFLANEGEAGASVILDGSGAWEDYELSATVKSPTQTGVFVWVRFQDVDNNAACNFGRDFVHVEQVLDGNHRVIQGVRNVAPITSEEFTVGARVEGRNVQCLVNGRVFVETPFLDTSLDHGGIGFKMWDETIGRASLVLKKVNVQPL